MKSWSYQARMTIVFILFLIMSLLHNNSWMWGLDKKAPWLFGAIPFAFWWYILYVALGVAALAIIKAIAWPDVTEQEIDTIKSKVNQ